MAQPRLLRLLRRLIKISCYLLVLGGMVLLAKGIVNLIYSAKIPFAMSEAAVFLISGLFTGFFLFFGVLLVIHFFKYDDS